MYFYLLGMYLCWWWWSCTCKMSLSLCNQTGHWLSWDSCNIGLICLCSSWKMDFVVLVGFFKKSRVKGFFFEPEYDALHKRDNWIIIYLLSVLSFFVLHCPIFCGFCKHAIFVSVCVHCLMSSVSAYIQIHVYIFLLSGPRPASDMLI